MQHDYPCAMPSGVVHPPREHQGPLSCSDTLICPTASPVADCCLVRVERVNSDVVPLVSRGRPCNGINPRRVCGGEVVDSIRSSRVHPLSSLVTSRPPILEKHPHTRHAPLAPHQARPNRRSSRARAHPHEPRTSSSQPKPPQRQTCGIAACDLHASPDPCAVCNVPGKVAWVCTDVLGDGNGVSARRCVRLRVWWWWWWWYCVVRWAGLTMVRGVCSSAFRTSLGGSPEDRGRALTGLRTQPKSSIGIYDFVPKQMPVRYLVYL
ncbi:hypothetical protein C8Q78DRAFT_389994 [Trametes maxima]|nr:hypothetical protein C8Q78DRAFT_389994 [Trametes maxima]